MALIGDAIRDEMKRKEGKVVKENRSEEKKYRVKKVTITERSKMRRHIHGAKEEKARQTKE